MICQHCRTDVSRETCQHFPLKAPPLHLVRLLGLTEDELKIALKNVGVDLSCGTCASQFYTGHEVPFDHTCGKPNKPGVLIIQGPAGTHYHQRLRQEQDVIVVKDPNSCNKHDDCGAAKEKAKAEGRNPYIICCHDENCEDCFGQ